MCRRIPNLETAIDECKRLNKKFEYNDTGPHIKFYVNGVRIMISRKKANPDRVRKDIRNVAHES